jgi:hypothetical protein
MRLSGLENLDWDFNKGMSKYARSGAQPRAHSDRNPLLGHI